MPIPHANDIVKEVDTTNPQVKYLQSVEKYLAGQITSNKKALANGEAVVIYRPYFRCIDFTPQMWDSNILFIKGLLTEAGYTILNGVASYDTKGRPGLIIKIERGK